MTSPWYGNRTSGLHDIDEDEQNYNPSNPWVDYSHVGSSYQRASSSVNLNLIPEMCRNEDNSHFEQAIANNDVELVEEEHEIEFDDSDDDDENDGNVGVNIDSIVENEAEYLNIAEIVPEFGDVSQTADAVCRNWDNQYHDTFDTLAVNEVFENKKEFIRAVKMWHIKNNYQYKTQRSNARVVQLRCVKEPVCKWYLRAAKKDKLNIWMITVIKGRHTCTNASLQQCHRQLDSEHIAQERFPHTGLDDYMKWYLSITRRVISAPSTVRRESDLEYAPHGSRLRRVAALALAGARRAAAALRDAFNESASAIASNWLGNCRDILEEIGEGHRIEEVIGTDVEATPQHGHRYPGGPSQRRGRVSRANDFTMHSSQLTQDDAGTSTTPATWTRHRII